MPAPDPTMRAGDHEREHVVRLLGEHTAAGRLSLDELDERVTAAYAATTLGELDALLHDLPSGVDDHGADRAPGPRPARSTAATPTRNPRPGPSADTAASPTVAASSESAASTCHPWASWATVGTICLVIWAATSLAAGGAGYFWPLWVIGPWAIVLLGHTVGRRPRARAAVHGTCR